ncbi:hypothetical protein [Trueperella pyogenes]
MNTIRVLAVLSVVAWTVATIRVWQDAHNPYTTMLCVILATMSAATTINPELILWENQEGEE